MDLKSFSYEGKDYVADSVIKLGEDRFRVHTTGNKSFIFQFNQALYRWVITEAGPQDNQSYSLPSIA